MNTNSNGYTLICQAKYQESVGNYHEAKYLADCAIRLNPYLIDAFDQRGRANWLLHQYDEAIDDFSKIINLDKNNWVGWCNRGFSRASKGNLIALNDIRRAELLNQAERDLLRSLELSPEQIVIKINILELEILRDDFRNAIALAGSLWCFLPNTFRKLVCAWLASCALVLAKRPERHWQKYVDFLLESQLTIDPTIWFIHDMNIYLSYLENDGCDKILMKTVYAIYELFLQHYPMKMSRKIGV